ncbi:hypothetical protein [Intestinimonas timonensis]|uniref:hypothetical protein n=1 Tax=Intestinimonas timonensis TaxID=1689270 RepID=UPI003A8F17E9
MEDILNIINTIISSTPLLVISLILGIDSVRAIIASLGIFNPATKVGHIIYGKYDRTIVKTALKDLGYSSATSDEMVLNMKKIPQSVFMANAGVSAENAAEQLIIMLSKYMFKFNDVILYGGSSLTKSNYYIDTMEISHNKEDKQKLAAIMIYLLQARWEGKKSPEVIVTPKGGNPLFVQEVANNLNSHLLVAKAETDKSRIKLTDEAAYPQKEFLVNYEGSWFLSETDKEKSCVVIDCNTSGGTQLLDIVKEIRLFNDKFKSSSSVKIQAPSKVFVLFRADIDGDDIDKKFEAHKCKIYRFFDLDEVAKEKMYEFKHSRKEKGRSPSYYIEDDIKGAREIIQYLQNQNLYYYDR